MKRNVLYILLLGLAVSSCTVRPRGVLSSQKMEDVLYDLHRAEGIITVKGYLNGHDEELARYYDVVLQKHGVTQAQFDSSLVWYTDNPRIFDKIYPKVVARLQKDMERLDAERQQRAQATAAAVSDFQPLPKKEAVRRDWEEYVREVTLGLPVPTAIDSTLHPVALLPYQLGESPQADQE